MIRQPNCVSLLLLNRKRERSPFFISAERKSVLLILEFEVSIPIGIFVINLLPLAFFGLDVNVFLNSTMLRLFSLLFSLQIFLHVLPMNMQDFFYTTVKRYIQRDIVYLCGEKILLFWKGILLFND